MPEGFAFPAAGQPPAGADELKRLVDELAGTWMQVAPDVNRKKERNARESMPGGGRVRVSVERSREGGVDVCVEDEGPGVDPELGERLFEPFFSTKSHGTGLGLAITRQIAVSHGGNIAFEPRRDRPGTRFRLHLPAAPV